MPSRQVQYEKPQQSEYDAEQKAAATQANKSSVDADVAHASDAHERVVNSPKVTRTDDVLGEIDATLEEVLQPQPKPIVLLALGELATAA